MGFTRTSRFARVRPPLRRRRRSGGLTRANRLVRINPMHVVAGGAQRLDAVAADESARSRDQHALLRAQAAVDAPSSGRAASRADMTTGSIGHLMARAGSFQRTPRSAPGRYGTEIMYKISVSSRKVMKPCAKPFGMNSARRLSAVNSVPNQQCCVGEPPRKSTITSKIAPAVHRTSSVSYTHLRAHETRHDLVCRLL